jgi:hypothetical protein
MKIITLIAFAISFIMSLSVNAAEQEKIKSGAEVSIQHNSSKLKQQLSDQLKDQIKNSIRKIRMTEYIETSALTTRRDVSQTKRVTQKSEDE